MRSVYQPVSRRFLAPIVVATTLLGVVALIAPVARAADGDLDTSFGSGGKVLTPVGTSSDYASALVQQADGKLVAAGRADIGRYDSALVRYNTDGSLDNGFGSGGKVVTPVGSTAGGPFPTACFSRPTANWWRPETPTTAATTTSP